MAGVGKAVTCSGVAVVGHYKAGMLAGRKASNLDSLSQAQMAAGHKNQGAAHSAHYGAGSVMT